MSNMRTILTIIGLLIAVECSAQTLAVSPGVSYGRFYDIRRAEGHFDKEYNPQFGYSFGIEMKDIALDTVIKVGFAVTYQNYGGDFYTRNGGQGGSAYDEGEITKDILGLEFYPINFRLIKKLRLSLGVSLNALLNYKMSGNRNSWIMGTSPSAPPNSGTTELNDIDGLVKPYYWGLNSCVGYEFEIGKIIIEPRYNFYVGLSEEFDRLQAGTKSMRQSIQLSIGYKIK